MISPGSSVTFEAVRIAVQPLLVSPSLAYITFLAGYEPNTSTASCLAKA